jgi:WD40 repeat protein
MRRWPTWLLVGALVALGSVAVADALRGDRTKVVPRPRTPATVALITRNEPAASGLSGVLYYSNAEDDCRLDGLSLPDLGNAPPPKLRSCRFSLSRDGQAAFPDDAEWSPQGGMYAREDDNMIELGSSASHQALHFPGSAPAFKPDGTFTYVRENEVVEWTTSCPRGSRLFTLPGDNATARCRRVVLSTGDLRRARIGGEGSGPLIPKDLAWLSDTRLVTVVGDAGISGHREHLSVIDSGRVVGATISEFGEGMRVEASPHGNFFTAWYGDSLVTIRDRNGDLVTFPTIPRVRALTWSPDERWTAVATEHSVFVFRTNTGEARVRRLPIVAYDLAWR